MNIPNQPLISIVIPAYNAERTIRETVKSVLDQSFADFELLVIDDGSTDGTLSVLEGFTDKRLQVHSFSNAGLSASRNRGTALARGQFVAFLDADDLWTPGKLAAQLEALERHPEAVLAYSWVDFIDENSHYLTNGTYQHLSGNIYVSLLLGNFLESGSNPLIRRTQLIEAGGFDETLTSGEDWDCWLRLAAHHSFVLVPQADVLYRKSAGSMSRNTVRMEKNILQVIERAFTQAPAHIQGLKPLSLANFYRYLTWKALDACPEHACSKSTIRYYLLALRYDPTMFRHPKILMSVLCEIIVGVLPFLYWRQQWASIQKKWALPKGKTLLECIQLEPTTP
jgi:glycosyltransferase involved in cell wall biosynthesis